MAQMTLRISLAPGDADIDRERLERFLQDPNEGVARDIDRRGDQIEATARAYAPVDSGALYATIRKETDRTSRLPAVEVIAGREGVTPYTGYVLDGTRPHEITPRGPGYPLRFYWAKVGANVAFMKVNHPGTAANPFLQRALEVGARD